MTKILVVGLAPYSVSIPSGSHVNPGEITEVDDSYQIQSCINSGKLGLVERPAVSEEPVKPTTKSRKESTSIQETE